MSGNSAQGSGNFSDLNHSTNNEFDDLIPTTKMLDKDCIKAMDGFAKIFAEGYNQKLEAMEKGGVDLRDQDRKVQKAKKQAEKCRTTGM